MKALKRLTYSVFSSFEAVVGQLENHEALVGTTIREAQRAAAKARVQAKRLNLEVSQMEQKKKQLEAEKENWIERAKRKAKKEKEQAIECLRRKKQCETQLESLNEVLQAHHVVELQLENDLKGIELRVSKLKQKKSALKSREATVEARTVVNADQSTLLHELDSIFDRWESKVVEAEMIAGTYGEREDWFIAKIESEEELSALKEELDGLLSCGEKKG